MPADRACRQPARNPKPKPQANPNPNRNPNSEPQPRPVITRPKSHQNRGPIHVSSTQQQQAKKKNTKKGTNEKTLKTEKSPTIAGRRVT